MGKKYKRKTQMKKLTILFLLALLTFSQAQIPDEYWQWVEPFNTGYSNFGQEVITNSQGNIFVISSGGAWNNYNGLIYKYSPNGELLWYRQFGGSEHDYGTSISVDNVGNVYVTGQFQGTADFGSFNLISTGGMDIFIAKIDSDGNWLWVKHTGSNSDDYGRSISVDNVGNVYVTGSFAGTASFGITTLSSSGSNDIFIAKMDSEGNWLWAEGAGGSSTDVGYSISVDNDGDVYVTGYFEGTADFGNISLSTEGAQDIFVAKIDSSGNWVWAERAGGQTNDYSQSISVTNNGVYITGNFSTLADFGPYTLSSNDIGTNQRDIFIAKLDKNGNWRWAERAGGASGDSGTSITVDNDGDVYVTGYFEGTADFGPFNYTTGTYQEDYNTYYEREMYIGKLIDYGNIIECMFFPNFDGSEYLEFVRALNYDIVIDNTPVFTFIDTIGFPVIILDSTMFFDMYGMLADSLENEGRLFGPLFAELPNDSASIIVLWNDVVMDSFTYRAIDYPETAGLGPSLEKTDSGWGPSFGNGTPGRDNGHGRISLPQDADPFHLNLMPHFDNPITGGDVAFSVFSDLETIVYPSITNDSILVVTPLWFGNDHLTVTAFYEDGSQQERRILTSFNNVFLDVPTQTPEFATIDTVSLNTWYSRTPQDGIFSFSVSSSDSTIVKPSIVQDTLLVLTTHWHGEVTIELTVSSNNDGTFTQTFPVNVPNPFISIIPNQVITNDTTQIHNVIQWFPHPVTEDVTFFVSSLNTDIVQTTLVQDTLLQFDVLNDGNALYGFTDIIVIADYPFNHSVSDTFIFTNNPGNTLVINEIHYNPAGSQGSDAEYEFIELANNSEHTIRLENTVLSNEVNYGFSESTTVLPDSFVVVARNKSSLLAWYSGLNNNIVFEGYSELLSNTTGLLQLSFNGYSLDSLSYSDTAPWPENADGLGSSLELVNPVLDNSDANSWRASLVEGGTPGFENSTFGYVPQWTQVPEMTFYEDIDTTIALSYWFSFVEDIGTPDSALTFSFLNTGQVTVTIADDSAHFSIEENWNGETEIGIRANNGTNYTDAAIPIIVSPVNDTPEITPISNVEYFEDDNLSFVLTSNDIDSEDLTYLGWSDTSAIFVTITDSLISFSSTLNWTGSGLITAAVSDGEYTNSTVFTVTVVPVNDAPVISGIDDSNFPEDSSLVIVLNSSDIENDDVTYTVFSDTSAILITIEDSAVTLSSNEDWNGESLITAVVSDGEFSDSTTFILTINPVNDAPLITLISNVEFLEDDNLSFVLTSNDIDSEDLVYMAWSDTTAILITVSDTLISLSSTLNWTGSGMITAVVSDGEYADSTTFTATANPVNDAPVISTIDDSSLPEDSSLVIILNSSDIENDDVSYTVFSDTSAILIAVEDSAVTLSSNEDWNGESLITAVVSDGEFADSTTFTLTIQPLNDSPFMLELIPDVSINEDAIGVVIINRLENYFGDIDIGDTLTFSTEILGAGLDSVALVMAQDSTHLLAYTVENFVGELTIAITATDDSMATISDTFMVEIMNINDPPVITIQQNAFTNEEIPITIAFSVYDEEGADVIMSGMADTASVIITMNDTTLGVIPELNWFGEAKLFLTADDGDTSVTDTVILTVENVNDVPVLSSDFSEDVLSGFISIPLFVDEVDGDAIQVNGVFRLAQSDNWELMNVNRDTSYGGNVEFSVEWETLDKTGNQINWTYSETAECSLWVNDGFVNSNALVFDSLTIANIAGDYNLDVKINASDIGQLVNVFYDEGAEVLGYDIGPSTGTAPFLITAQDFVIDFEDLATFTQMWYWGAENLPTLNQTILAKSVVSDGNELFSLLAKSNGILTLKISEMMTKGFDLFVQYDTTEIQFENIQSQVGNSAISLAYHQAESGYFSLSVYSKNGIMDFSGDMLEFVVSSKILDVSEIVIGIKMYENPSDDSPFEYYRKTIKSLDLLPKEFALHQNYPNPFNPVTTLRYDLPEQAHVGIIIYDIMGREVIMLVNQSQTPGFKSVVWNGKNSLGIDVSAGMYLYRISAENFHSVKKMVLLK